MCPFVNAILPIVFPQVFLSEVKKECTNKTKHWAAVFKNPHTDGCSRQKNFT